MTDGQVLMVLMAGFVFVAWVGLIAFETWLDVRYIRRDPVIRDLRARAHDNAPACLEARGDVSTDSAKESTW